MKKILLVTIMFLLFAGVVSASTINGDYKGNPIVKVIFNGIKIDSEVPAIVIDGVTMIPLRAIADNMDSVVSWNADTYTVGIYQRSFITSQAQQNYSFEDAVHELGFPGSNQITVAARDLAIELLEIRKTKKQSDYSVQDALKDLGIPQGLIPTLATLKQAVKLISLK
jgi:hypothetical protein